MTVAFLAVRVGGASSCHAIFPRYLSALISSLACFLVCASACRADVLSWNPNTQGQFITALCPGPHSTVWIGTEDEGVWHYDPAAPVGKQYTHYTTQDNSQDGLGDDNAYALAVDQAGRLWAGTLNHGVSVFNGKAWRTYGPLTGPLGSRVFALAVSPKDGGVWGATEAGLFRYQNSRWTYFTREGGLPSDQANALAFDPDGTLYVGTQCDGIAIASPADGYRTWRTVPGPRQLPNAATGNGLPSALINCLLVTKDGTVYAGTPCGLASSGDKGRTWHFRRGIDWKDKEMGLAVPVAPSSRPFTGTLLREDYVTCLAEDGDRSLWVGYRQRGVDLYYRDPKHPLIPDTTDTTKDNFITALLPDGAALWVGRYGGGLTLNYGEPAASSLAGQAAAVPFPVLPFPVPAPPPTLAALNRMLARVKSLHAALPAGRAVYLGEDWQTQGDWVGRYGRQYAVLCAMNHVLTCTDAYSVEGAMGGSRDPDDGMRWWVTWLQTDNPKSLYTPVLGTRRQAEWDDHGEAYAQWRSGPDLWITVRLSVGEVHRISLYFVNIDGQFRDNRIRDYLVEVKPYRKTPEAAEAAPTLARARVRNFWGGVYEQFAVKSPGVYCIKISRNGSFNTILSGVFIDKVAGPQTVEDGEALAFMNGVHYDPPAVGAVPKTAAASAAMALWKSLDGYEDVQAQEADQVLAYRALASSGASPALLANWRWKLGLWTADDRAGFDAAMAHAREVGVKLAHARTPADYTAAYEYAAAFK